MKDYEYPSKYMDRLFKDKFRDKNGEFVDSLGKYKERGGTDKSAQLLRNAFKFMENLPNLPTMGRVEMQSLIRDLFGPDKSNDFKKQIEKLLRQADPSQFVKLHETGDSYKPVQKYADALAYGSDAGYNAMLPYWMEKDGSTYGLFADDIDAVLVWLGKIAKAAEDSKNTADAKAKADSEGGG